MKAVLEVQNFAKWMISELRKLLGEIKFFASKGASIVDFKGDDAANIREFLDYLVSNETRLINAGFPSQELKFLHELAENRGDNALTQESSAPIEEFLENGFTIARIKLGSKPNANYAFAQDAREIDYYIHVDIFEQGNWTNRHRLVPGAEVAIKFEDKGRGPVLTATEAWLIEQ